ncbi:MAG TPA: hypothetical protein VFD36_25380 [Kofleriaceae bacterium]|nr:hypothetical protein [Kofleriaceae bacterium]
MRWRAALGARKLPVVETVVSYGLAILGFGMMASVLVRTMGSNLKYIYTRPLLINTLRKSANHAELLCKSGKETYFAAIGEAIKTGAMMQSRDPKVLVGATAPAYDAVGKAVLVKWGMLLGRVKLGAMAAGGAVVVAATKGFPPIAVLILAIGVGIGYLWLFLYKAEIERCIVRARAEILPEVDRAFVEGRYVFPPPPPT